MKFKSKEYRIPLAAPKRRSASEDNNLSAFTLLKSSKKSSLVTVGQLDLFLGVAQVRIIWLLW